MRVPDEMSDESAASLMEVWCTACQILYLVADVRAGETVLVHAAASGVGTAMLQLAKRVGAVTIAVASTDEKL